nr:hypothetical protein [Actinomycetota bacterium]
AFGIAFTTYLIALGVSRALCSDPLVIRFSADRTRRRREAVAASMGAALVLSFVLGAVCAVGSVLTEGPLRNTLLVLSISLPGLLMQDSIRFALFAVGAPARAAFNDALWLVLQATAFTGVLLLAKPTPALLLGAWGLAATLAAIIGPIQLAVVPNPARSVRWLRDHLDLGARYVIDYFAIVGSVQVTVYGLAVSGGLSESGAFRGAQLLLGPLTMLFFAALSAAVPEGVRMRAHSGGHLRSMCGRLAVGLPAIGVAFVLILLAIPDNIGIRVMGPTWNGARSLVLPLGLATAATGVLDAANSGLRALADARRGLHARLLMLPFTLVGGLGGALTGDAHTAAIGLLAANIIGGTIWWLEFERGLHATPLHQRGAPDAVVL